MTPSGYEPVNYELRDSLPLLLTDTQSIKMSVTDYFEIKQSSTAIAVRFA